MDHRTSPWLFSVSRARALAGAALAVFVFCALPATIAAAQAPAATAVDQGQMSVRLGAHDGYTRLVFDFPRLTAYRVESGAGKTRIVFDTPLSPAVMPQPAALLKGIGAQRLDNNTLAITLTTDAASDIKHYRLMRRVVVDIHGKAPAPPPVAVAAAPKPAEKKTAVEKPAAEAPSAPPVTAKPVMPPPPADEDTAQAPAAIAPAELGLPQDAALRVDTVAAAPVETVEAKAEPTAITLSTVEPTKMAVFTRAGALWLVMAGTAGSSAPPAVAGPDAAVLGEGQQVTFTGGRAYRYTLPANRKVVAARKSLQWTVKLGEDLRTEPSETTLDVGGGDAAVLTADLKDAGHVLRIEDPVIGDSLLVVPAASPAERLGEGRRYANVEILPAAVGMAIRPLGDDIGVEVTPAKVTITGAAATKVDAGAAGAAMIDAEKAFAAANAPTERLFDFPNWLQGGIKKLNDNRRAIDREAAAASTDEARLDALQKLALLYFANGFGEETLAVLRLVMSEDPELEKNPNILALRGAAAAMAGHYDDALQDLSTPAIQTHPEVRMWTGYAAAASEQWRRADGAFPRDTALLSEYPPNIAVPMMIYMAESALRLGHADTATQLLDQLKTMPLDGMPQAQAAIDYLRGEAARQDGRFPEAIELWTPVAEGLDRLYHTKASLALTLLQLQEKQIDMKDAIDRIDSLRFAWRGDGLEVQTLAALGRIKILDGQYVEGLEDLRTAAGFADQLRDDSTPLRDEMVRTIEKLFVDKDRAQLKPLQAISVYNTFGGLLPEGEESRTGALNFADYLVQMDLLDRAATMISEALDETSGDADRADIGTRLAAIYLLDGKPALALDALLRSAPAAATAIDGDLAQRRTLLRARAQSQLNQTDDAIATLAPLKSGEAKRLTADVLWRARRFADAAAAIETLLPQPLPAKLDDETARLVMNMAVGYKLAGDSEGLAGVRARFAPRMAATAFGPTFTVVTRDGGSAALGDRDTILKIAGEVDMFRPLLDSYKAATQQAGDTAAPAEDDGG